jgi:hypothetical protein
MTPYPASCEDSHDYSAPMYDVVRCVYRHYCLRCGVVHTINMPENTEHGVLMSDARPYDVEKEDGDIPVETRRALLECAASNGRISYYYLLYVWRRGWSAGVSALKAAQSDFCSNKCPSVFTDDSARHIPACVEMQIAIERAERA